MSPAATFARPARRRIRWLGISVALNVFLVAILAAFVARPLLAEKRPRYGQIGRMIDALPAADALRMRTVLDRARPEQADERARVSAAQREVAAAIGRTPYDEAAVRRALAAWQASWQGLTTEFNRILLDALGTLSDEGRARFAAAVLADDARRRSNAD